MKFFLITFQIMSLELRKILHFRLDFWVTFVGQISLQVAISWALWSTIFKENQVSQMNGFSLTELNLYYLLSPLLLKIMSGENIGFMSRDIYEGGLNKYLIYPLSFFHYKISTFLTYSFFYLFQLIIILFFCYLYFGWSFGKSQLLGLILILVSTLAYFLLLSMIEQISFWADNIWSLGVIVRFTASFLGGGFLPLVFFPSFLQKVILILPFQSMLSSPLLLLMNKTSDPLHLFFDSLSLLSLWIISFVFLNYLIWKKAQYRYTGIGM